MWVLGAEWVVRLPARAFSLPSCHTGLFVAGWRMTVVLVLVIVVILICTGDQTHMAMSHTPQLPKFS